MNETAQPQPFVGPVPPEPTCIFKEPLDTSPGDWVATHETYGTGRVGEVLDHCELDGWPRVCWANGRFISYIDPRRLRFAELEEIPASELARRLKAKIQESSTHIKHMSVKRTYIETRQLTVELTADELNEAGQQLAHACTELQAAESRKKTVVAQLGAEIKSREADVERFTSIVSSKNKTAEVSCEWKLNTPARNKKVLVRADTGVVVESRDMDDVDRSQLFPDDVAGLEKTGKPGKPGKPATAMEIASAGASPAPLGLPEPRLVEPLINTKGHTIAIEPLYRLFKDGGEKLKAIAKKFGLRAKNLAQRFKDLEAVMIESAKPPVITEDVDFEVVNAPTGKKKAPATKKEKPAKDDGSKPLLNKQGHPVDEEAVKASYLLSRSIKKTAEQYGLNENTLKARIRRDKWSQQDAK